MVKINRVSIGGTLILMGMLVLICTSYITMRDGAYGWFIFNIIIILIAGIYMIVDVKKRGFDGTKVRG